MDDFITFEQPLNEHMRACLRLEYLFKRAIHRLRGASLWDSRDTVAAIIEILNVFERPDIKNKLTKELSRHLSNLSRLEHAPHVDNKKLAPILLELENLVDLLHATTGKIGQELRENEFLNSIRQYLVVPGGASGFDTPAYELWLNQPATERTAVLSGWLHSLEVYIAAVHLLLKLTRESSNSAERMALNGVFQATLDPQAPCQLVQVTVAKKACVYPEISVSRHGICVRFFSLNIAEKSLQTHADIPFKLTSCVF